MEKKATPKRWKKFLIITGLVILVLVASAYAFLSFFDFNNFKPMITRAVKGATGRELTIGGDIDFKFGSVTTLVAEDIAFQNAPWGSRPHLATVKRLEVAISLLPLIRGDFEFSRLVLVEPSVVLEISPTGATNFEFETADKEQEQKATEEKTLPVLAFGDARIEKGVFTYRDGKADKSYTVRIDRLNTVIPGFEEPVALDFEGAFDNVAVALKGTVGPIIAWIEPGHSYPVDLTANVGSVSMKVTGETRDPINFKDMAFSIAAEGPSVAEVARLAGVTDFPEVGAFKLEAGIADPDGKLALEQLKLHVGSKALAEISIEGRVKDLAAQQGIDLRFTAQGDDSANLTQFGIPPPPARNPFSLSGRISDTEAKVYSVGDLKVVLGENEAEGDVNLNLGVDPPYLTANLASRKFALGPFNLSVKLTGPADKLAIETLDLKLGTEDLAQVTLNGSIKDLQALEGVDLKFEAHGKDLANLAQLTGKPLPLRGAFKASGEIIIPVHKDIQIPQLKILVGENTINGSLELDLRGKQPLITASLASQKSVLASVMPPKMAKQAWAKALSNLRPWKLAVKLAGFSRELALEHVDLRAGTTQLAEVRLKGSVRNLPALRGIDLDLAVRGNDTAKLEQLIGRRLPVHGNYAVSGKVRDAASKNYRVSGLKIVLGKNNLTGRMDVNLAGRQPEMAAELSTQDFSLKPLSTPSAGVLANLKNLDSFGPLKIETRIRVSASKIAVEELTLSVGSAQLAVLEVKGAIKNPAALRGINLGFKIRGSEIANLKKLTGQALPIQGPFAFSGRVTDPSAKNYRLSDLTALIGQNNISGRVELDLGNETPSISTELSTQRLTLQSVTIAALEPLRTIPDLGPFRLALKLSGLGAKPVVENLDLSLGTEKIAAVSLKGSIKEPLDWRGFTLDFTARGDNLVDLKVMSVPQLPLQGAFAVSGRFVDPGPKIYQISSLEVTLGDYDGGGSVELNLSRERPRVTANLSSEKIDLRPYLKMTEKKDASLSKAAKPTGKRDKVFSRKPWPLDVLKRFDADIKIRDKELALPRFALNDVVLDLLLEDGNLTLKPVAFKIGGGQAECHLSLSSGEGAPVLSTSIKVDQFDLGSMLDQLGYQRDFQGNLDIEVDLTGQGNSTADLMAGLDGRVLLFTKDGQVASKYLEMLQRFLGTGVLRLLNPLGRHATHTPINCFVNHNEIDDGMADLKILVDTNQTSIFGAGDINLKPEQLNLGLKPTPKKRAGLSGVGSISFNFSELSQPFKLGGTLANPSLELDPSRTAFTIGKFAGALALGPAGVALFFSDVSLGKKDPCEEAAQAIAAHSDAADDTGKKQKKKPNRLLDFFKRLFNIN